jgi:hypothetical protein
MGRTYFNCHHCDASLNDDLQFEKFNIKNYGKCKTCLGCAQEVASLLKVVSIPEHCFIIEHKESGIREIFEKSEDMKKRLANLNPEEFIFGIRKGPWKEHLRRAFLEQKDCGLSKKEIENIINKILEKKPNAIIYAGWMDGPSAYFHPANTTEQTIELIEDEKLCLKVEDKPMLIGDEYGLSGYGRKDIEEFCCLRQSNNFLTFDNVEEFEKAIEHPEVFFRIREITWGVTCEFLEEQIKKIEPKIQKLVRKRNSLEDLRNDIKKNKN